MSLYPYLPTRHRELLPKVHLMCSIVVILSKFTPTNIYDVGCNGAIEGGSIFEKSLQLPRELWLACETNMHCVRKKPDTEQLIMLFLYSEVYCTVDYFGPVF